MLHLNKLRELNLRLPSSPGRPLHLSAASGLVQVGSFLYVIADDEFQLGVFSLGRAIPGELISLFPGELPASDRKRKARKPDLEALCLLPPFPPCPHGALFALGSGSKTQRQHGVLLALNASGAVQGLPRLIDLGGVFAAANAELRQLNIEAAVVLDHRLRLLQRGNKGQGRNACIDLDLTAVLQALEHTDSLASVLPIVVRTYDLGEIDGAPLCFSDGAALPNRELIFTAIAEDTSDSYFDGSCLGAAIGIMNHEGELQWLERLEQPLKIEGINARVENNMIRLLLVTDADDAAIPAALYSAEIGYPPRRMAELKSADSVSGQSALIALPAISGANRDPEE